MKLIVQTEDTDCRPQPEHCQECGKCEAMIEEFYSWVDEQNNSDESFLVHGSEAIEFAAYNIMTCANPMTSMLAATCGDDFKTVIALAYSYGRWIAHKIRCEEESIQPG